MSFLGVGPLELLLVLVIALLVVGPRDLVNFARKFGVWLRKVRRTETWQNMMRASWELQHWQERLQEQLMEESGLREIRLRRPEESLWHPPAPWRIMPPTGAQPPTALLNPPNHPPKNDKAASAMESEAAASPLETQQQPNPPKAA